MHFSAKSTIKATIVYGIGDSLRIACIYSWRPLKSYQNLVNTLKRLGIVVAYLRKN